MIYKRSLILRKCEECNTESYIRKEKVIGRFCRSCRAKLNARNKIGKHRDLFNQRFGKLIAKTAELKNGHYYWNCVCDCGNLALVQGTRLRLGKTKSCGCLIKTQNGLSESGSYQSWSGMMQRCYDKRVVHYQRYGALGIKVDDKWHSFLNFFADMGMRPVGATLDRINGRGNYEPDNCRWATPKQQANNKKNNHKIEVFGLEITLTQLANAFNLDWSTLRKRIVDLKWDINKSLTKDVRKCLRKKNIK